MNQSKKKIIILGAGPAGLAAGLEAVKHGQEPIIIERDSQPGGLSKTVSYKGFYFDLGGHRFFTKNKEVDEIWRKTLGEKFIKRPRLSRIYYRNRFFYYPLKPLNALLGVGLIDAFKIVSSYFFVRLRQHLNPQPETTFEEWVSHRFGKRLYEIFFKTYTEKVWGIPGSSLGAEWAAQRIKNLSLWGAILNAFLGQKGYRARTLIDQFDYPIQGPGMMYQEMARQIQMKQGRILFNSRATEIFHNNSRVLKIKIKKENNYFEDIEGDYFLSSIPLTDLLNNFNPLPPPEIQAALQKLRFRSFISVNLIIDREKLFPDNWIYVHSPEVRVSRIQNFKNWSPYMTCDPRKTPLGLEYHCNEGDGFWNLSDEDLINLAKKELAIMKIAAVQEVVGGSVSRVPDAYPVYQMGYQSALAQAINYVKKFKNLQPIGRGGMYRYNNMDHSMLTGFLAVRNIVLGEQNDVWRVNEEEEYCEEIKK